MQPSNTDLPIETRRIPSVFGPLELLICVPRSPTKQAPLLCVHGAHCAAACFKALLPLFAGAGYASYAISVRGHGGSWQPSTFAFHALTGINSYVADTMAALDFVSAEHPDVAPIFVGHSMGGAILQRVLGAWDKLGAPRAQPAGLILLASAPLSGGGMDVARRWQEAEAALAQTQAQKPPVRAAPQGWVPWLLSIFDFHINTGVDTPAQVRNKFFSPEADEGVVQGWLRDSKGRLESIRVSIEHFWPFANANAVLVTIQGEVRPRGRKILCISGGKDILISKELMQETFEAYRSACQGDEEVLHVSLAKSAHHVMLDVAHEQCVEIMVKWIREEYVGCT